MNYQSTRNAALTASSAEAILNGLAPDGGLYAMPALSGLDFDWKRCLTLSTQGMATEILCALLPDFTHAEMEQLVHAAYTGKFETEDLTPTVPVGEDTVLELFRGPTSAFKDVALSMLPHLMTAAKKKGGVDDEILILTATSGDTGKAAMEGFCDVAGTKIIVFYPDGGVSAVQKAQMVTQGGDNTCVAAVRGNFDDAQTAVKQVFAKVGGEGLLAGKGVRLSSANSINIGRLAPQVVYYFRAYADLVRRGTVAVGERVDYVVPTGNFGDILAGYFARELGLPVGTLVCASNANNVLTDFIRTGRYDKKRPFYLTSSPSMDILVSSNLERLLFLLSGDEQLVAKADAPAHRGRRLRGAGGAEGENSVHLLGGLLRRRRDEADHRQGLAGAPLSLRHAHRRGVERRAAVQGGEPRSRAGRGALHRVALQVPRRRARGARRKGGGRRVRRHGAARASDRNSRTEEPPRSARAPRAPHHRPRPREDAALCPGKGAGKEVVLR
ncbi:MAG: threonine synthase [Oscillospiraceae bacterium]